LFLPILQQRRKRCKLQSSAAALLGIERLSVPPPPPHSLPALFASGAPGPDQVVGSAKIAQISIGNAYSLCTSLKISYR